MLYTAILLAWIIVVNQQYSALLRLPRELSFREKLARVEKIIEMLRLQDCANTSTLLFIIFYDVESLL